MSTLHLRKGLDVSRSLFMASNFLITDTVVSQRSSSEVDSCPSNSFSIRQSVKICCLSSRGAESPVSSLSLFEWRSQTLIIPTMTISTAIKYSNERRARPGLRSPDSVATAQLHISWTSRTHSITDTAALPHVQNAAAHNRLQRMLRALCLEPHQCLATRQTSAELRERDKYSNPWPMLFFQTALFRYILQIRNLPLPNVWFNDLSKFTDWCNNQH